MSNSGNHLQSRDPSHKFTTPVVEIDFDEQPDGPRAFNEDVILASMKPDKAAAPSETVDFGASTTNSSASLVKVYQERPVRRQRVGFLQRIGRFFLPNTFSYFYCCWFALFFISVLSVIERFTINLMPAGQLNNARLLQEYEAGRYFVFFGSVGLRATARMLLILTVFFFLSVAKVTQNVLIEFVKDRNWTRVCFSDAVASGLRFHRMMGLFVFVPTIVTHVGFAFVPLLEPGISLNILPDSGPYPFVPPHRVVDFLDIPGRWSVRADDIYQAALGALVLFVQVITIFWMPLRRHNYNWSKSLHIVGAFVFVYLVYRVPEHFRVFSFATVPVVWWIFDLLINSQFYRRHHVPLRDFTCIKAGPNQMVLTHTRVGGHGFTNPMIGDVYRLQLQSPDGKKKYPVFDMEFSHEFTHFSYRRDILKHHQESVPTLVMNIEDADLHDPMLNPDVDVNSRSERSMNLHVPSPAKALASPLSGPSTPSHVSVNMVNESGVVQLSELYSASSKPVVLNRVPHYIQPFTVGAIIKNFGSSSFTRRLRDLVEEAKRHPLSEASDIEVVVRGPFRRVYSRMMTLPQSRPYLILTSGSGISLILDYILWVRDEPQTRMQKNVHIVTSTRDIGLFQLVADLLREEAGALPLLSAVIHLTDPNVIAPAETAAITNNALRSIEFKVGRCNVKNTIITSLPNTEAFVIGNDVFRQTAIRYCWEYGVDINYEESY